MAISRRRFLGNSAALTAAATSATHWQLQTAQAEAPRANADLTALPALEVIALNRMAYGPRPGDIERVRSMGFSVYVEEQLNPAAIDDRDCDARLAAVRLKTLGDLRPLTTLSTPIANLWFLTDYTTPLDDAERKRPFDEVQVATWIRAVYSRRQLQEVLVDFWHNHFNVNAASDVRIAVALPGYDRDVIRAHCLGNFRALLETVAGSPAMLYYLDNVHNRASGGVSGNENYARELFEQHTLGVANYLRGYTNADGISANADGHAQGYVDMDIYEAARCLSGWTVANGENNRPNTGEFFYDPDWHDPDAKTVLSVNGQPTIAANQGQQDGHLVLDRLARHRETARNLCTRLCRRLIADNPPASVVDAAVDTWMAHLDADDQIRRVVRTILLSEAFQTTWGQKIKRPFEAIISYLRATGAELPSDTPDIADSYWIRIFNEYQHTGQRLFAWPTPEGHPDLISYWASPNGMLRRWNLPFVLTQEWGGNIQVDLRGQTDLNATCVQIVDAWIARLCSYAISSNTRQALIDFLAQGGDPDQPPQPTAESPDWGDPLAVQDRALTLVQLLAASPDFHAR